MQAERTQNDLIQEFIPVAGMRHLSLPDGSQVQLNSKSTLLYPKQFTMTITVTLFLVGYWYENMRQGGAVPRLGIEQREKE